MDFQGLWFYPKVLLINDRFWTLQVKQPLSPARLSWLEEKQIPSRLARIIRLLLDEFGKVVPCIVLRHLRNENSILSPLLRSPQAVFTTKASWRSPPRNSGCSQACIPRPADGRRSYSLHCLVYKHADHLANLWMRLGAPCLAWPQTLSATFSKPFIAFIVICYLLFIVVTFFFL